MLVQYSKFNKMAASTSWRRDIASLNYIETSKYPFPPSAVRTSGD